MRGFFLDFETTGLVKRNTTDYLAQPGIVQVAIVVTDPNGPGLEWSSYSNPEIAAGAWEEGAIKTTGITPEKVKDAPTFFEIFPKIVELAKGCDFWGGYNTEFDRDVLWYQLLRFGFERNFPWPPADKDVMRLVKNHFEQQGKRGVSNLKQSDAYAQLFGEELADAHDALADIKACVRIYRELTK
jgi:DNA polymerase-3 subunit epsilon